MDDLTPEALAAVLKAVAPFSMVLDARGGILMAGAGMQKLVPAAVAGTPFLAVFEPSRPADPHAFLVPGKALHFFSDRAHALKFKCTVQRIDAVHLLLAANPVINAEQPLGSLGLTIGDLPPQDPIAEYAFLHETYRSALEGAQQSLAKAQGQEAALRAVLDSSMDQIAVVDMAGHVVRWNHAAAAFHGLSESQAVGRSLGSMILPVHYEAAWGRLLKRFVEDPRSLLFGRSFHIELPDQHGRMVPLEVRINSMAHGDRFLHVSAHDLTERVRMETELRNSEAYYRSVMAFMDLGLLVVDLDERVLSSNAAMAQILGMAEEELVGRKTSEVVVFADQQAGEAARRKATAERLKGLSSAWEVSIQRPDGSVRHIRVSGAPRYDAGGTLVGTIGIHLDITERIALANELERSRNWFRALVSRLPGIVFLEQMRPDPHIEYISEFVAKVTGFPAEAYLSGAMRRHDHVHPEDAQEVRDQIERATSHLLDHTLEYRIVNADGRVVWVREVGRFFVEQERLMLTGSLFNISQEREAQDLIEQNERTIEALAPATAALLEDGPVLDSIAVGMRLMGAAMCVDRISLFRLNYKAGEVLDCGPILKWTAPDRSEHGEFWKAPIAALGPLGEATLGMKPYTTRQAIEQHAGLRAFMGQERVDRFLSMPLRTSNGPWGFLCIDLLGDRFWTPEMQMATLEAYAAAVSEALERDRINTERDVDLEVEKSISRMAASMLGHRTEASLLEDLVQRLATEFGLEHCVVYRVDEDLGCLVPRAAWREGDISSSFVSDGPHVHPGSGIVGDVYLTHRVERIDDTSADPRYVPDMRHRASELVVPVMFGDRMLGVINSENDQPAFYGPKHERTLVTVAALLSAQLVRLEEQERSERERKQKAALQERLNLELESALLDRNKRLRELEAMARYADSNPSPVMRISSDGRLIYANGASGPVLAAMGLRHGEVLPPELLERFRSAPEPFTVQCGELNFEMITAHVPEFGFMNIYGTDVTSMHRLQVAQEELVAQERLSAIGRLTAGVAHEINSPLGAVVGSAQNMELLLRDLVDRGMLNIHAQDHGLLSELIPDRRSFVPANINQRTAAFRQRLAAIAPGLERTQWPLRMAEIGWHPDVGQPWERLVAHPRREQLLDTVVTIALIRESLHTVRFAAERASKVVQALRSYMHRDEERRVSDFDLARQLRMVSTLFSASGRKGVVIHQHIPENFMVKGVEDELAQVWTNLMSNAMQAVGDVGDITVELRSMELSVTVSVMNNGPAIPADVAVRMFDPMFTTKRRGEGNGLGLSIVKRFVESHGGLITFESTPECTIFMVTLPTGA